MQGNWILIRDEFGELVEIAQCPDAPPRQNHAETYVYTKKPEGWIQPGFRELMNEEQDDDGEAEQHEASRDLLQPKPD